jgi:hypothetical protein
MFLRRRTRPTTGPKSPLETVFTDVYTRNLWLDAESVSGPGSTLARTAAIRQQLPDIIAALGIASLLDAPCGDCNWMRHTPVALKRYVGADIVPALIAENRRRDGGRRRRFIVADITRDVLPRCDAVLCRDCLIHLSFADIARALHCFCRSGARYLLVTNHPFLDAHEDIAAGWWRSVNLHLAPFSFPLPLHRLVENPVTGKTLDVWAFTALDDRINALREKLSE